MDANILYTFHSQVFKAMAAHQGLTFSLSGVYFDRVFIEEKREMRDSKAIPHNFLLPCFADAYTPGNLLPEK